MGNYMITFSNFGIGLYDLDMEENIHFVSWN